MKLLGIRLWLLSLALIVGSVQAQAGPNEDLCDLIENKAPAKALLSTFVIYGDYQHGLSAASYSCPRLSTDVNIRSLGNGKKARSFYSWILAAPKKLSGVTEVQATINFSGSEIRIIRLHAYREIWDTSAEPFFRELTPAEQAAANKSAREAAEAAHAASR